MSTHGAVVSMVEDAYNAVDASDGFVDAVICLVTKDGGHATLHTPSEPGTLAEALRVAGEVVNPATWSSEWPTASGWYWVRNHVDQDPECVYLVAGGFGYYRSDHPGRLWGSRIPEPETP